MSSSPQEREKLRKRLQKLFQETIRKSATGKINNPHKDKMNNTQKTRSPKQKPVKENSQPKKSISNKNVKKQLATKKNVKKISKDELKQNGFVKVPDKETKLQTEKKSTATNTKEKIVSNQQYRVNTSPPKHKKMKKQVKENVKLKKSGDKNKGYKNINGEKLEKTSIESQSKRNVAKSQKTSPIKQSDSIASGSTKINKIQKKKDEKRANSEDTLKNKHVISNKKQKLLKKADKANKSPNKNLTKSNKKQKNIPVQSDSSSSESEDDYDVNGMTGYVGGGDFDTNNEENEMNHKYWIGNTVVQRIKNNTQADMQQYDHNKSYDSDVDYFDSEDSSLDFDEYYSDSYEEEDEHYSDFDENDYEEDEDSFNYTMDNDNDYTSSYDGYDDTSREFNDSDDDYELPKYVLEDLIIHKGTAIKRDLKPEDNVFFDNEESQIVELKSQHTAKVIYQPKAYEKEELLKLKYDEKSLSKIAFQQKETTSIDSGDCPKLVPIVDEDGFQLYNPNENSHDETEELEQEETEEQSLEEYESDDMDDTSLGSEYTELNSDDTDSSLSEDINEKYLKRGRDDSESDSSIDENIDNKKQKVDIIDATDYKYENKVDNSNDNSDNSLNDDSRQIPSIKLYENVDLKTDSSIFSTTIVDCKISNENFDDTGETQNTQSGSSDSAPTEHEVVENLPMEKENRLEESPKVSKSCGKNLGDYNTKFFNALESNLVIVLLKDPFYIYGTVRLTLLAGTVEVYGHSLSLYKEVEIFSPRGCSVIEISPTNKKCDISNENLRHLLEPYERHFALTDLKTIANLYDCERDAIVLLKRNESRKKVVQQFKKFMNENVFPNISNINVDRPSYNSEYLLRCMINTSTQEQKCLRLPEQWQNLSLTSKSRVMLAGGKGVGKSTLLRYLINRHLPQQILLIDLDIGQPEVFIPQTISSTIVKQPLLGPGFMLNLQPEISYAIGHTNIALCAHKYIEAVRRLIAHCRAQEEYKEIPWLINTMGYNKGFGLELISVIAQELPLTDVIQLQSTKEINNFDSILHDHVLSSVPRIVFPEECDEKEQNIQEKLKYRLHVWQSAVEHESRYQKEWEMSAKDLRFAMLLARLSDALQGHADWLTDVKPVSVSLDEVKIINLMDTSPSAFVEVLEKSIEANLVYLCHYEEEDCNAIKCLGIGVVRAIDLQVRQLYLIPALPQALLTNVNCLAIGEMPLPTSLFTNQGPRVKNVAPFVYNTIDENASKGIKQIYHRSRKFLRGNHKAID